jgi:sugar O-acyltransferase (sialic acid O-acetyltransferase NeuD family)
VSRPFILLIGAGGHARACVDVVEQEGRYAIGGLLGLPAEVGSDLLGYPVVGTDADAASLRPQYAHALVTVGQIKTPEPRVRLHSTLVALGFELPTIVSPRAYVSRHARVGAGTIVMHGAIVNAGATVGRNCIINSQSLVEHDVSVGDHCHVSTGARINSGVQIGAGTFIGSGSTVREGLTLGERCLVGMGQRVLRDCPAESQIPPRRIA